MARFVTTGGSGGGGGGGTPPVVGPWGPDFGGVNGDRHRIGVNTTMPSLGLTKTQGIGIQAALAALGLVYSSQVIGLHQDLSFGPNYNIPGIGVHHDMPLVGVNYNAVSAGATYSARYYDGTNDYEKRGGGLTGVVDGSKGTCSYWVNLTSAAGGRFLAGETTLNGGTPRWSIHIGASGIPNLELRDSAGAAIYNNTSGSALSTGVWHHVLWSWDLTTAGSLVVQLYVDDVQQTGIATPATAGTIDYTTADVGFGAHASGGTKSNAAFAFFFLDTVNYLDLSVASNRRKFINADLTPAALGSDGSTPFGTQPAVYTDVGDLTTNLGAGGNFTLVGALDTVSGPSGGGGGGIGNGIGVHHTMPSLALVKAQGIGVHITGSVLGAPLLGSPAAGNVATTTNAASVDIPVPSGVQVGDFLLAIVGEAYLTSGTTPVISAPSGWTSINNQASGGTGTGTVVYAFYKVADGTEGSTQNFSSSVTSGWCGTILRVLGVDGTTPINVSAVASGNAVDPVSPTITTTVNNCLRIAACMQAETLSVTYTPPSGYVEQADQLATSTGIAQMASEVVTKVQAASGASGTVTHDSSQLVATNYASIHIAIAPGSYTIA